jgi:2,4-dienoyl-CoA reductase-like NADH-dependent reductase (Old Yellow Enzyme family)/thioredoxin reductase
MKGAGREGQVKKDQSQIHYSILSTVLRTILMKLLEPITLGQKTLKNRIVVNPYTFWFGAYNKNEDFNQYAAHLERQAAGGVAMLSLQAIWVPPVSEAHAFPYDYLYERLKRVADIAHRHGALAIVQSVHMGANLSSDKDPTIPWDGKPLWAFSPVPSDITLEVAHEMTDQEVRALVEGWGRVAELAVSAGLDGMELHGGHGYLLHQSISPWMNRRTDEWGKPLAFWKAVLQRVRAGLGNDAILGARFPSDELRPLSNGGLGRLTLKKMAVELVETGLIDYINPSEGSSGWHYPRSVGTYRRPHGDFLESARELREAVGGKVPVLGVGRITTPEEAEEALQGGNCDFVGMVRANIADPDLVNKLKSGNSANIRKCVGANACINRIMTGTHVMCFHNPETGREDRLGALVQADRSKRVLVVGGGPAGLKVAEIAAKRGHSVVLAEKQDVLGGRLKTITNANKAVELVHAVDWVENELVNMDVEVRLGTEVDEEFLKRETFDALVLATGSQPNDLPFPTDGSVPWYSTEAAMSLVQIAAPAEVLVLDSLGSDEVSVVIEQLAAVGHAVTVVTPLPTVGTFLGWTHAADNVQRLLGLGCRIAERTTIIEVKGGTVTIQNQLTEVQEARQFDHIVVAQPRLANDSLRGLASSMVREVHVIGDALAPRDAMTAFLNGEDAGRAI